MVNEIKTQDAFAKVKGVELRTVQYDELLFFRAKRNFHYDLITFKGRLWMSTHFKNNLSI